jgi:transposase
MSKQVAVLGKKRSTRKVLVGATTIGVYLGDQWSHYCMLDRDGEVTEEGRFRTTEGGVAKRFADMGPVRIAMEAGTHSIWILEQLNEYGHEVIVANVTELRAISRISRWTPRGTEPNSANRKLVGEQHGAKTQPSTKCKTANQR